MRALMVVHCRALVVVLICLLVVRGTVADGSDVGEIVSTRRLRRFVDHLSDMPRVRGYRMMDGIAIPRSLTIGMFEKKWHQFETFSVPGLCIAVQPVLALAAGYTTSKERGEHVPPEDSLDVARKVKEMYCYTCSDIVKARALYPPMG